MTFTGFVGTVCMFPLRAIIATSVALRIHPNTLTLIGVLVNVAAACALGLDRFLLAGFIALLGDDFFNFIFIEDAPAAVRTIENVIAGPIIAVLSFVCSIGNAPLAAVLWSGGISFAGVIAFIFADLIVLPIVIAYGKYYGWPFALRITALMFVTIVAAALVVDGLFSLVGLIPDTRPSREDIFGSVELDYKLVLNVLAAIAFVALIYLTMRPRPGEAGAQAHEAHAAGHAH